MGDLTKKFDCTIRFFTPGENGGEDVPYTGAITVPDGFSWTEGSGVGEYTFRLDRLSLGTILAMCIRRRKEEDE